MDAAAARAARSSDGATAAAVSASPAASNEPSPEVSFSGNAALWRGIDQAHIMGLELIVAVALWGGIGWWIDARLGTGAWFTVIGALLGNAAGIYLVWLRAQRLDGLDAAAAGRSTASTPHPTGGPAGVR